MKPLTFLKHINKYHRLRWLQRFINIQYTDIKVCCSYNVYTNKVWIYHKIEMPTISAYFFLTWQVNKGIRVIYQKTIYLSWIGKMYLNLKYNHLNYEVLSETINWTSYEVLSVADIPNLIHVLWYFLREKTLVIIIHI